MFIEQLSSIGRFIKEHKKITIATALALCINSSSLDIAAPLNIKAGFSFHDKSGFNLHAYNASNGSGTNSRLYLEWIDFGPADSTKPIPQGEGMPLISSQLSHRIIVGVSSNGVNYIAHTERVPERYP